MKKQKLPKKIEELQNICFACGSKWCKVCGGMIVKKPEVIYDNKKKKQFVIFRFAPLGCFLAHNKEMIMRFYKDKELIKMFCNHKDEKKMYCRKCLKKGKKVSMKTEVKEKAYVCPKCNDKVKWQK